MVKPGGSMGRNSKRQPLAGQVGNIDIRLLRIFRTVVDNGGFSAAEVELGISISAISIAVSDLETRLGMKLCRRGRAGFSVTDQGTEVYQAALRLLGSLEDFRTQVNSLSSQLKGELNIGITDNLVTMQHMRVTEAMTGLKQRGPDVQINIRMIPPGDIEKSVLDGRLHIGVIPDIKRLSGLEYLDLYDEEMRLYCSANHPLYGEPEKALTVSLLNKQEAVVPASAVTKALKAQMLKMRATATSTDREGVAFLILSGRFIGFLPTHYAANWLRQGQMRELLPQKLSFVTPYAAVTRRAVQPNLVLQAFIEELAKDTVVQH